MARLDGRVALVTGAGRGIGASLARQLAAEGARVVVNDLDAAPTQETVDAIIAAGGLAAGCPGSVTQADFPRRFVSTALEAFGGLHIIVNNAGYIWNGPIHKITDEQWDAIQDVHLKAPFRILREAFPHIRDQAVAEAAAERRVQRKVVNISSVSGTRGSAGQANYAAAKAGLVGLTKTLAKEWGRYNVNVNCVAFGFIDTRLTQEIKGETAVTIEGRQHRVGLLAEGRAATVAQIPLGRAGTPDEAAGGVLLLCLPEADYITGQVLEVGGGLTM
ncbi:SDR family NAD(P)-dependent oxidoreductase [Vineibacter terrae]|uniref:SDR family NAD(P)-dependent oxidoreductase n=1 Tax=Vineibacter terrae TaxID=2586908 RepID=UPI002E32DDBB|nr:SDR family oxidoreductase [Vineibacter terrae]HEX2891580.1 SDR family oxidoreductase [Vineibacter terrae]